MNRKQATIRRARAMLGLGLVDLEWNNVAAAEVAVREAMAGSERFPEEYALCDAPLALADVKMAQGEMAEAQRLLSPPVVRPGRRFLFRSLGTTRARLALARGDLAAAERWATGDASLGIESWPLLQQQEALAKARLQIAQGAAQDAIGALERALAEAGANGQTRREIELNLVLAQAQAAAGHGERARSALLHALALGQPASHRRLFLQEGPALARLLQETAGAIEDESLAAYARALFYTFSQEQAEADKTAGAGERLVEPLTEQELRVLRLLSAGLSNPQIGEELVISVNTVKTHVKNVYSKLAVSSREEAREAARALGLL